MGSGARMILDLFAGPGGWDVGASILGLDLADVIGIELDDSACATRAAAGLRTYQADVSALNPSFFALTEGDCEGLIASPPCQAFSQAGKREGIEHVGDLLRAIAAEDWSARPDENPLVWLALEVGRWASELRPRWLACEQVPSALPLWKQYRGVLERWGYSAWAGVVTAEQYGVPQTRERAFLMASLDRAVGPPPPTHERYESRKKDARRGQGGLGFLKPWVSMAEALGWAGEDEPARTLCGRVEPRWLYPDKDGSRGRMVGFARADDTGSSEDGYRERDWRSEDEPAFSLTEKSRSWTVRTGNNTRVVAGEYEDWRDAHAPQERSLDAPAPTVDGKAGSAWTIRGSNERPGATEREPDEPAPTIAFGHAGPELVLNTGMDWKPGGDREDAQTLPTTAPAPTLTALSASQWWLERPATTVAGDERLWPPGHKENADDPPGKFQQRRGEQARKLSIAEALALQSFPTNYPVQGTKTAQHRQVGDAVPPLLAAHVLAAVTGMEPPQ